MKRRFILAISPIIVLAGCSESDVAEPAGEETAALEDLAAGTGPYLVTYADGSQILAYSAADGTEIVGTPPGAETATWAVTDGKVCIDPPGENEDGSANNTCITMGEVGEDGSWSATPDNGGDPVTMRRVDGAVAGPDDQMSAGTYLVDMNDDTQALIVWASDGTGYLGLNAESGTWRADGEQRCSKLNSEEAETCGAPTSEISEDGSFTAQDEANGTFTVQML